MSIRYISATKMATERSVQTADIFQILISLDYIKKSEVEGKWELLSKGIAVGGKYNETTGFIYWPENLQLDLSGFKKQSTSSPFPQKSLVHQPKANTEGERYIKEFFREAGIKYKMQVPIKNLSHDNKAHRVADFYLEKYDVYVEFFGNWNTNEEHKEIYRAKKNAYKINHIPCIYIYPENLGYIEFAFDSRIIETLKNHHKEQELSRYKWWKFYRSADANIWGVTLSIIAYVIWDLAKIDGKAVIPFIFIYNSYQLVRIWHLIYVKDSYSIKRMLYD